MKHCSFSSVYTPQTSCGGLVDKEEEIISFGQRSSCGKKTITVQQSKASRPSITIRCALSKQAFFSGSAAMFSSIYTTYLTKTIIGGFYKCVQDAIFKIVLDE